MEKEKLIQRFDLRMDKDIHKKLRVESFKTGISMNELINELLIEKYKEDKNV